MGKNVLISCGPIPARLDSVKFITNRFKGGLAFETAQRLADLGHSITIVKWKHTIIPKTCTVDEVIDVIDVVEYFNTIKNLAKDYDAFILAAAVANLMPSNPYENKFPSHNYKVGDQFDIKFEIAPRVIDVIKQENPRCCLVGYKLYDAESDSELIEIGRHTLKDSKANVIFANTPATAKTHKIALTQDNSAILMSFDEHVKFIDKVINAKYYKTSIIKEQATTEQSLLVRLVEQSF